MSKARQQEAEIGEGMIYNYISQEHWNLLENFT